MSKTVPLSKSYTVGSETFSEVVLREPLFGDLLRLGEPFEVQKGVVVRYHDTIAAYVDRLVEKPAAGAVRQIGLKDGVAVRDAVLGFFLEALRPDDRGTNSSSASAGAPAISAT